MADGAIKSPCIQICVTDPSGAFCLGCGRSVDEIARWVTFTHGERAAIMSILPQRRAEQRRQLATTKTA